MSQRHLSLIDQLICQGDRMLRSLTPGTQSANRPSPASTIDNPAELDETERRHVAGLMRVNHAGEVCAQALYQGQALTARLATTRRDMERAADEEIDHLAWCEMRLNELDARTSLLNPLWYGLSFGLGAAAGAINDRVSLGFVAATEERVGEHLRSHLTQLPAHDLKSRAVLEAMAVDEEQHGRLARKAGGIDFPAPIKAAMSLVAKAMTLSSYRI